MATPITVKGKRTRRPGTYSSIESGIKNQPISLDYGNVLIIDTNGLTNSWAAGSGINGALKEGKDAFYTFDNNADLKSHLKGGYLWSLADLLFIPKRRIRGVSSVTVIKPAVTTAATISFAGLTNGSLVIEPRDEGTGANGVLYSSVLGKGYAAKMIAGVDDTSKVYFEFYVGTYRGADTFNANKHFGDIAPELTKPQLLVTSPEFLEIQEFVTWAEASNQFQRYFNLKTSVASETETTEITTVADSTNSLNGTYFTIDTIDTSYYVWFKTSGGVETDPAVSGKTGVKVEIATDATNAQVATAVAAALDLLTGFDSAATLNVVTTVTVVGGSTPDATAGDSGFSVAITDQGGSEFVAGDLVTFAGYTLASGGTETFNAESLTRVFDYLNEIECTLIISTHNADNAQSSENTEILTFIETVSKYERVLFVGGGNDKDHFALGDSDSSIETAVFFDSDYVAVVHGGEKKAIPGQAGNRIYDSLYKTFKVVGRQAGLPPQVPLTLKALDITDDVHKLSEKEQEQALQYGVVYTYYDTDFSSHVIGQGITTIQFNDNIINNDGTTFSIALQRIKSQINREMALNSKRDFYGTESGPNRNTVSLESVETWVDGFLNKKVATNSDDNLIISYDRALISAEYEGDTIKVNYGFVPNLEVNKMVITGFILES